MPSAVLAVLGPYPAGLGSPGTLTVDAAAAAVQDLEPAARGLLDRLATGIPRGTTDSRSTISKAVATLITDGLLRRVDPVTVELPREVGLALRGDEPLGPIHVEPPRTPPSNTACRRSTAPAAGRPWPPWTGSAGCSTPSGRIRRPR